MAEGKKGEPKVAPPGDEEPKEAERKQPIRLARGHCKGDYEGWWFDFDDDYTLGQLEALSSGRFFVIRDALSQMITKWNYVDKAGQPILLTGGPEPFAKVSKSLTEATVAAVFAETTVPEA